MTRIFKLSDGTQVYFSKTSLKALFPTGAPAGTNPTIAPAAGTVRVGDFLNATPPVYSVAPTQEDFDWLANGVIFPGGQGLQVQLPDTTEGKTIQLRVTAQNAFGTTVLYSNILGPVAAAPVVESPLIFTANPAISGSLKIGQTLNLSAPSNSGGVAPYTIAYQARRDGIDVSTGQSYVQTAADDGKTISWLTTVTDSDTPPNVVSVITTAASPTTYDAPTAGTISNRTFTQGTGAQIVDATAGFSGSGLAYSLDTAPAGTTINATSGQISVQTTSLFTSQAVTVRAVNSGGSATVTFTVTVSVASAASGFTSETGDRIILPLPSGFSTANQTIIDTSKVTVVIDCPSVNSTAGATTLTNEPRRVGIRGEVDTANGQLIIPMAEAIPACASAVRLTITSGGITNGAASITPLTASPVANNATFNQDAAFQFARIAVGENDARPPQCVLNSGEVFAVEANGGHESGIACVRFDITVGGTTVTRYATTKTRSRYRDNKIITSAQWTKNSSGGIGVFSTGALNPNLWPDGEATCTITAYPRIGGAVQPTVQVRKFVLNAGGTFTNRIRYVDNVSGVDTNDGLTAGTAVQTITRAMVMAASINGGASATSIPIIYLVGSGNPAAPRVYGVGSLSGSGNAIPAASPVAITIKPAPGYTDADTWIAGYSGLGGGVPRARHMIFSDIGWDIANAAGAAGTSAALLVGFNVAATPGTCTLSFVRVKRFHHLGRAGQLTSAASAAVLTNFPKNVLVTYIDFENTDMRQMSFQAAGYANLQNVYIDRISGDVLKQPECAMAIKVGDTQVDPRTLYVSNRSGTILVGDTVTGVYSTGSLTVESVITGAGFVGLPVGQDQFTMKRDDSLTHDAITVASGAAFAVGDYVKRVGIAGERRILRKDTNIIRVASGSNYLAGATLVKLTGSGGTETGTTSAITAVSASENNIFFEPSGVRARHGPPHPDGVQIQSFTNQRIWITGAAGTFQVGEKINCRRTTVSGSPVYPTDFVVGTVSTVGPDYIVTAGSGNTQWKFALIGGTVTGETSGATATLRRWEFDRATNFVGFVYSNWLFQGPDGVALFGENGLRSMFAANILAAMAYSAGTGSSSRTTFAEVGDAVMEHCSFPNQKIGRGGGGSITRINADFQKITKCAAYSISEGRVNQGGYAGTPVPGFGCDSYLNRGVQSAGSVYGRGLGETAVSPVFTGGATAEEDYDAAKFDYSPGTGSGLRGVIAAGANREPFDLFGNPRPTDGTAALGAVEAWVV